MKLPFLLLIAVLFQSSQGIAGDHDILHNSLIRLPADELEQRQLLDSISGFLQDMATNAEHSDYVDSEHLAANALLFDELQGFAASTRSEDENFYRGHLLAATPAGEGDYIVQIALMGNPPEGPAVIRMIFRMRAVRSGAHFQFRCLMEQNEREWTHESIGNIDYTFEGSLDRARALRFDAFNTRIAEQLDMEPQRVSYIRCRTSNEALGFLGIDYHIATNGSPRVGFNDGFRFVTGFDEEGYEHDLLHIYFSQKFDGKETYRAFEEGIAAFYAGSWGEPYLEIQRQLGEFVDSHANVDLGVAYKDRVKIGLHDIRYAINALLVEEIEREHGFDAIVDVLHCGSEGERYFEMLDKYLEIDEQSFGESILQRLKGRG